MNAVISVRSFLIFVLVVAAQSGLTQTPSLKLNFSNLRNGNGALAISVFAETGKNGFPGDPQKSVATRYVSLQGQTSLTVEIPELAKGTYAIAVLHDEDGNREYKSTLGVPREGFGFSKNPKIYFGAPSFKRASFEFDTESSLDIKMKYFF